VDEDGDSNYVTEGLLRALHRKISKEEPLYISPIPFRSFMSKDAMPLVIGEPAEITFDLLPTSYLFRKGHRIRVAISGADASHFVPLFPDPPQIKVYRDKQRPSHIDLPIKSASIQ
jgi:predicted acyl esterase